MVLLCAVGHPESVRRTVVDLKARVVDEFFLPDHHAYGSADVSAVLRRAEKAGASVVTTAKDQVELGELGPASADPLWVLRQEVVFEQGEDELGRLLEGLGMRPG